MTAEKQDEPGRKDLQRMLDIHGGDSTRWSKGAAESFRPLLARDAEAREALAAARALDSVLATAPEVSVARRIALADRIFAEAFAARDDAPRTQGEVIDLASRRAPVRRVAPAFNPRWQVAAVLAASLLLGVFAGITGQISSPLDDIASITGLGGDTDALSVALNQAVEAGEEDPL